MKRKYAMETLNWDEIYVSDIGISHNTIPCICIRNPNKPNLMHYPDGLVLHSQRRAASIKFQDQIFSFPKMQNNPLHKVNFLQSFIN